MTDLQLWKRRPAQVVARAPHRLPQRVETIVGTERAVAREVRRLSLAGHLAGTGELRLITRGQHAGRYELRVVLIEPPEAPRWARRCTAAGWILLGFSAVVGSFAWLISAMSASALAAVCITVLVAFVAWLRVQHGGRRGRGVTVTTTTVVEMR